MPKYRKKPIVVEAVEVLHAECTADGFEGPAFSEMPSWLEKALKTGMIGPSSLGALDYMTWTISTLEGDMTAGPGWHVICGIEGELYPIKNDIFEATYEKVDE